ncbi:MAG: helicase-exonuclease AddAB subunit AddA [Firmicutes bacterium]|nr:helicase-exonuclease AddAB subunit AddA [Bacillota bacterium]
MGFTFTENQNKVLNARGHNVLVSAAAGSGKTAVLVERIIRMITEGDHPCDIDRLLVVTFTRAAAGEMRERIAKAVTERLAKDPENRHLQKQETLLHHAQITTIDSFCSYLLRNSFATIDLDPGFRQMDETENALLESDVCSTFLDALYEAKDPDLALVHRTYCQGLGDAEIPELLLSLLHTSLSHPFGDAWLQDRKNDYVVNDEADLFSRDWMQSLLSDGEERLTEALSLYDGCLAICRAPGGPGAYEKTVAPERDALAAALLRAKNLTGKEKYEALYAAAGMDFGRLGRITKKDEVDPALQEQAKSLRDLAKESVRAAAAACFPEPLSDTLNRMKEMAPVMNALIDLTLRFHQALQDRKREKNVISFADLEQYALEILLVRSEDGTYTERPEAAAYRSYFDEILIDEYQDSNEVQELLLSAVSGERQGRYARFMVGDVKQSIYRFRNARPEIFGAKLDTYLPGDPKTERIDLDQNFRSRTEVLDAVNLVFRKIMRREIGGVAYDEDAALKPGAKYPASPVSPDPYTAEFLLIRTGEKEEESALPAAPGDGDDGEDEIAALSGAKKEALAIAERIRDLIATLPVTDKETGTLRPCRYRDIVILIRSGTALPAFRQIFERENIPLYAENRTGYFAAEEVRQVLQLLRIIQNPRQDIPLYGALRGYFGGFSEEEIARIRAEGDAIAKREQEETAAKEETAEKEKQAPLLLDSGKAFLRGTAPEDAGLRARLSDFSSRLSSWREQAKILPIHELLTVLIHETGFDTYVAALPAGAQRRANVEELIALAQGFEQTAYRGVFAFVRYLDQMQRYSVDQGEAGILDENADVVRIMTIHKSKGLEFPVCFVAGLASRYSFSRDTKGRLILDSDLGLGADYVDLDTRSAAPTLRKNAVAAKIRRDSLGEELRVLYVAMTRAKEKLILTAQVKDMDKFLQSLRAGTAAFVPAPGKASPLPAQVIAGTGGYLQLLLLALFGQAVEANGEIPSALEELPVSPVRVSVTDAADLTLMEQEDQLNAGARRALLQSVQGVSEEDLPDPDLARALAANFAFRYPHEDLRDLYTKTSVSDLKHAAMEEKGLTAGWEGEGAKELFPEHDSADIPVPKFISLGKEKESGTTPPLVGAARGTAIHRACELIPYRRWKEPGKVTGEEFLGFVEEMIASGEIPEEYRPVLLPKTFLPFLSSGIAGRMAKAAATGHLRREQPFVYGLPADEVNPAFPHSETILIQGIIDAFFLEKGPDGKPQAVVVDYKTDRVRTGKELADLYATQLDLYARALEGMLGVPVAGKILYSFALQQEVPLP